MNNRIMDQILESIALGRPSHAYLFYGAPEAEMENGARTLAQSLNCLRLDENGRPCKVCESCRKIEQGVHPDITWVLPDEASMKIGQIRPLMGIAQKKPLEAQTKVIVLENIHKMTEQAANSLLKLLEEPPESTVIILITQELELVLPTILSRCQRILLNGENTRKKDVLPEALTAARILESLPVSLLEVFRWPAALDKEKDKSKIEAILYSMELIYRDRMVRAVKETNTAADNEALDSPMVWIRAQGLVREALWLLSVNVNALLVLESLFIDLRKIEIQYCKTEVL